MINGTVKKNTKILNENAKALAWSPDGKLFVTSTREEIQIWRWDAIQVTQVSKKILEDVGELIWLNSDILLVGKNNGDSLILDINNFR